MPQACRSEEHTSELQSPCKLVCRLLLEKKKIVKSAATRKSCKARKINRSSGAYWFRSTVGVFTVMLCPTNPVNDGNKITSGSTEKISTRSRTTRESFFFN